MKKEKNAILLISVVLFILGEPSLAVIIAVFGFIITQR